MTIEQFAKYWEIEIKRARYIVAQESGIKKYSGKFVYPSEAVIEAHKKRLVCFQEKQPDEIDFYEIKHKYCHLMGFNLLIKESKKPGFPKIKRKIKTVGMSQRIWNKQEIDDYFKDVKRIDRKRKMNAKVPVTKIKGLKAMVIFFNSGQCHRLGENVNLQVKHTSYFNTL
ncbi:MAG: hypothetical protein M0R47_16000 [Methylobacter sp.]|uniref:hypothetical protein n=1 Tax=Methylobacter sp. TaxID=2051955 RepID=UPI0025DBF7C8|nr:hypothetical protein [Methylobacter sp.]MCK9622024.1 hypothetical protein [Methylobacter sp.]